MNAEQCCICLSKKMILHTDMTNAVHQFLAVKADLVLDLSAILEC